MITDAFDRDGEEIIRPENIAPPVAGFPETAIAAFKPTVGDELSPQPAFAG